MKNTVIENMEQTYQKIEYRKSIPFGEYCAAVDAVATTVVSDTEGYRPQLTEVSIYMTMLRHYAIGYENITAEQAWEWLSEYDDFNWPDGVPVEAERFVTDCRRAIEYRRDRNPIYSLIDMAKSALIQMGKEDPNFFPNLVKTLKTIGDTYGGDAK